MHYKLTETLFKKYNRINYVRSLPKNDVKKIVEIWRKQVTYPTDYRKIATVASHNQDWG